jgi:hypothetical protein
LQFKVWKNNKVFPPVLVYSPDEKNPIFCVTFFVEDHANLIRVFKCQVCHEWCASKFQSEKMVDILGKGIWN